MRKQAKRPPKIFRIRLRCLPLCCASAISSAEEMSHGSSERPPLPSRPHLNPHLRRFVTANRRYLHRRKPSPQIIRIATDSLGASALGSALPVRLEEARFKLILFDVSSLSEVSVSLASLHRKGIMLAPWRGSTWRVFVRTVVAPHRRKTC